MMLTYEFHVLELGIEMNVYDPRNFSVLLGGSMAEWPGRRI